MRIVPRPAPPYPPEVARRVAAERRRRRVRRLVRPLARAAGNTAARLWIAWDRWPEIVLLLVGLALVGLNAVTSPLRVDMFGILGGAAIGAGLYVHYRRPE